MANTQIQCRVCYQTREVTQFYASDPRKCKICLKASKNKGIIRDPQKVSSALCLECGQDLPIDKFDISKKTGLLYDKCIECRILRRKEYGTKIDEVKSVLQPPIIYQVVVNPSIQPSINTPLQPFINAPVEISQEDLILKQWIDSMNLTKENRMILFYLFSIIPLGTKANNTELFNWVNNLDGLTNEKAIKICRILLQ